MVNYRPDGFSTITPFLTVEGANKVIDFIKAAFDVTDFKDCHTTPDGKILHAELKIGDSWIMLGEANADCKPAPTNLYMYVPDTDKVYKKALAAGAKSLMEPADQFWGDRNAGVEDSAGNKWWIATHIEDVSPEEMERRAKAHKQPVAAK